MKTMSKILATILIVVLCVSLFTVQAFADEHDDYTCTTLTSVAKKDATCTEDGMEAYWVCDTCGKVYKAATASAADYVGSFDQLKIPATGHTFDPSAETKATCFSPATNKCTVCGETFETGPKLNHALGTEHAATVGADCKTNGTIKYYDCANGCGAYLNEAGDVITTAMINSGEKGAHTWGEWKDEKPATATSAGTQIRFCSVCHESQTRSVDALGVPANTEELFPLIASRDTWYRGEELPMFTSELIRQLNAESGSKSNYVGVRIGTSQSMYANSYATLDFWSSGSTITLGENLLRNLDAGTYYIWVYDVNNQNRHTNSIPFYIVDVPTLEPINTDKHVINSTKNLRFRASEPITAESVKVGGKSLYDPNYYYVSNDGLTITLSPDFLNERQAGTYTISANTRAGGVKVSCPFYILSSGSASSASPKTADESQLGLWAAFLLLSGAAVVVLIPKIRKHSA